MHACNEQKSMTLIMQLFFINHKMPKLSILFFLLLEEQQIRWFVLSTKLVGMCYIFYVIFTGVHIKVM
jgi:hypothetical protein